jgi:hypothetical protein
MRYSFQRNLKELVVITEWHYEEIIYPESGNVNERDAMAVLG